MAAKSLPKPLRKRPAWDEYFLDIAKVVRTRSNCLRMSVGAVLIKQKRIIATGYNGTPSGVKNCVEGGCERCHRRDEKKVRESQEKELCICVHAEQNALLQSAYHGTSSQGSILYSTIEPCLQCAKSLINAGVKEVIYLEDHYEPSHQDHLGKGLLKRAGIAVRKAR